LLNRLALREGDVITTENMQRIRQIARETDHHLTVGYRMDASDHSIVVVIALRERNPATLEDNAKAEALLRQMQEKMEREKMAAPASATGVTPQRIRVGGSVQAMNLIKQPRPVYPPLAKQARIQGIVRLIAIIGRDGTVQNLEVESGHPLLVPAAMEAVKEWVYKPTLLNGQPIEVLTQIDVAFTLSE
jgi:TonB family protein